jgi:hypothetical protein
MHVKGWIIRYPGRGDFPCKIISKFRSFVKLFYSKEAVQELFSIFFCMLPVSFPLAFSKGSESNRDQNVERDN